MWINCRKCGQLMDDCFTIPDCVCFDCWDEAEANGELYYCSDCGQVSALPLKNDKCEECSSRSASSGKKKKPKIQKAAALIMSMMIALSCLCVSAFAEEVTTEAIEEIKSSGTYLGYETFQISSGEQINAKWLMSKYDEYFKTYSTANILVGYLFGFDDSGNIEVYSQSAYGDFFRIETSSLGSYEIHFPGYGVYLLGERIGTHYSKIAFSFDDTKLHLISSPLGESTENYISSSIVTTNGKVGFNGFCTDELYFVLIPYDKTVTNTSVILKSLVSGNKSDDFVPSVTTPTYTAKFHSFASMNDGDVILNMLDWIGAGKQYPIADFSINDNGQYHDYSLRISLNKNYVDVCMGLWEDWKNNLISSALPGGLGCLITGVKSGSTTDIVNGVIQLKFFGKFPLSVFTLPTESGTAAAVRKLVQYNMIKSLDNLSYVTQYNLTDSHLNFAEGESSVRAYSVCLADYVTIVKGLLYRLDIVDNNTGMILDTAYFCNDSTYAKTNTGYGTKVYNYDSADDLNNDLENDNGYISNSGKVETDKMQTDNNTDIVVNFDPNELDLGSYMDSLNGIVSDVSSFFTWVWQLFPPEIMTIIIIGVGLLVTCGLIKFFVG